MAIQVFKFGGVSVQDAAGVKNVTEIIRLHKGKQLVIVVSAMAKTTNALEALADAAKNGNEVESHELFDKVRDFHYTIIKELFPEPLSVQELLEPYFDDIKRIVTGLLCLNDFPERTYDRIMAFGELISSVILREYLLYCGLDVEWFDARQLIKTDVQHQKAEVLWGLTQQNLQKQLLPVLASGKRVLTQGYIASTLDGKTTTLGREGSDYTASIIGASLKAEQVTIWKDVPGVMSADPKLVPNAVKLPMLPYEEAVAMTFYGASVIHPKTIKPLRNQRIPLVVNSFLQPEQTGTVIGLQSGSSHLCILQKKNQALISLKAKDFSFIDTNTLYPIWVALHKVGVQVNLVVQEAITLHLCVEDKLEIIQSFEAAVTEWLEVEVRHGLMLQTYLHAGIQFVPGEESIISQRIGDKLFLVVKMR
ncbi:MAG: aspartate kinase [Bacteroidia bacterium]|nr:aspartate kinase [Bacteroidia bacterium]